MRMQSLQKVLGVMGIGIWLMGMPTNIYADDRWTDEKEWDEYVLEEITTTASKTGETDVQKTPIAITSLSEERLKDSGVIRLRELGAFVPNVEFTHNIGDTQGFIRGVGNFLVGIQAAETNVAYYVDGIYIEAGSGLTADFFDLERIEILRGPQGTLYGRNANGGAINFITKKAGDVLEGDVSLELGNFNLRRIDASVGGPLAKDKIKARLAVSDSTQDGLLKNISSGNDPRSKDFTGFLGSVEITPSDPIDIVLTGDYSDYESTGPSFKLNTDQGVFGTFLGAKVAQGFWEVNTNTPGSLGRENWGVSGTLDYRLPENMTLRSITGYREYESSNVFDIDGNQMPLSLIDGIYNNRQFSEEIQYQISRERFLWMVGGFYYRQESSSASKGDLNYIPLTYENTLATETDSYALFSNIQYVLTSRISAEAGIRYSTDDKTMTVHSVAASPILVIPPSDVTYSDDWSDITPRFAVNYRPTEAMMVYFSAAKGYRPGGFAPFNFLADNFINPEYVWSYEMGIKADWLDKRLRTNTALFYSDYKDIEVLYVTMGVGQQDNAAKATIKGAELEFTAIPMQSLILNGTIAYLDATYDEFLTQVPGSSPAIPIDVSGNSLPYAPQWSAALGAQYNWSLGVYGRLILRGNLSWKDRIYFDQYNRDTVSQAPYTVVSSLLRFETTSGRWSTEIYGTNIFEEEYITYSHMLSEPTDVNWVQGDPRLFGIRIGYRY